MRLTLHALRQPPKRATRAFRASGGVMGDRSAANGHGSCNAGPSANGGCQRPDCIFGLIKCGWHDQA